MLNPKRWKEWAPLFYAGPTPLLLFIAGIFLTLALLVKMLENSTNSLRELVGNWQRVSYTIPIIILFLIGIGFIAIAILERIMRDPAKRVEIMMMSGLCKAKNGNPLKLREGQIIPTIRVKKEGKRFRIRISCPSAKYDDLLNLENTISAYLVGGFSEYGVLYKEEDHARRYVDFIIENRVAKAEQQDILRYVRDDDDGYD